MVKLFVLLKFDNKKVQSTFSFIQQYESIDFSEDNFLTLKNACTVLLKYIPFPTSEVYTGFIARCRRTDGNIFATKDELSYNKNTDSIKLGRFNLPKHPMFYASAPIYDENNKLVSYFECCPMSEVTKELKTKESISFPSFFTMGYWKIIKNLIVINLCYEDKHLSINLNLSSQAKENEADLKSKFSESSFKQIQQIWSYFSELSKKWSDNRSSSYSITTAFYLACVDFYKNNYGTDIDGVLFPSAMTDGLGLNIAINPQCVDDKLALEKVQMYILKGRDIIHSYRSLTDIIDVEGDSFSFGRELEQELNLFNSFRNSSQGSA